MMWDCRCIVIIITGAMYAGLESIADGSQHTFYRVWADYGVAPLGKAWNPKSAGLCAVGNMQMHPTARSFMFNPIIPMCIPGGFLDKTLPGPSSAEGDLFVDLKPPQRLRVLSYGNWTACIGFFPERLNYKKAAKFCQNMGYFLPSVKNLKKLDILTILAGDKSFWVGCDDITLEGSFVWKEDSTEISSNLINAIFSSSEPNNNGNQDCCLYRYETNMLDDFECTGIYPFACEVSLDNCF